MTRPDEAAQSQTAPEELVAPDIVPPARPAAKQFQPEKTLQLKNRIISARMAILFFAVLLIIAVLLVVIPRSDETYADQTRRNGWPELSYDNYFSGNYAASIMKMYTGRASGLSVLKTAGEGIRSLFGPGSPDLPQEEQKAAPGTSSSSGQLSEDDRADYYDIVQSRNYHIDNPDVKDAGSFLIVRQDGHWRSMPLYSEGDISLYAGTINYIRQMLDESVNLYVMPIPLSTQYYLPSNYANRSADMKDSFRRLSIQLISGIQDIDIIDVLNNHNAEAIYLRTDDHWAPLAAYYVAREFTRIADVPFTTLDSYISKKRMSFTGDMYELTGSPELLNDPEDFVYYVPPNDYRAYYYDTDFTYQFSGGLFFDTDLSEAYYTILGKDDQIVKISTDAGNGRNLLLVKDSYGNAIVPFLTGSFETIYIADQQYFNFNLINFANYAKITDLLFINDYASLYDTQAELLEYITYSNLDADIEDKGPSLQLPENGNPDITGEDPIPAVPEEPVTTKAEEETTAEEEETEEAGYEDGDEGWYDDGEGWYDDADEGWYDDGEDWDDGGEDWDDGGEDWYDDSENWDDGDEDWYDDSENWDNGGEDWYDDSENRDDGEDLNDGSEDWNVGEDWNDGGEDWDDGDENWDDGGDGWYYDEDTDSWYYAGEG